MKLIEVMTLLAEDDSHRPLCAPRAEADPIRLTDRPRIDRTLEYVQKHYQSDISMSQLADLAALSVSGLHRLFKRHTRLQCRRIHCPAAQRQGVLAAHLDRKTIACISDEVG